MTSPDPVRRARAYLLAVAEPPAPALAELIHQAGPIEAARAVAAGRGGEAVTEETTRRCATAHAEAEQALALMATLGARLATPEDDDWPAGALAPLYAPPPALWVRGTGPLDELCAQALAMAGADAATGYGEHLAADTAYHLALRGITIVTAAGRGIAEAATRGALAAEGAAVRIQPAGLAVPYPASQRRMVDQVADRGLVVSEYPPNARGSQSRRAACGRLVVALSTGLVLIETAAQGQVMTLAEDAAALGTPLMAMPGPVTSTLSVGCHQLIRDGRAVLVTGAADVLQSLARAS